MIDSLIHTVFLGIEIEILILLFILIRENLFKQGKRRHHPPSPPPQQNVRYQSTSTTPTSDVGRTEQLAHSLTDSSESDSHQEAAGTPASPDISQDISPHEDDASSKYQDDTPREIAELSIKKQLICSIKDLNGVNAYSSQAQLVEKEHGELLVVILENGSILAIPSGNITTERKLNDVFRPFFEFDMPTQPDAKKFRITCERAAGLTKNNQSFSLLSKGRLKVDVD